MTPASLSSRSRARCERSIGHDALHPRVAAVRRGCFAGQSRRCGGGESSSVRRGPARSRCYDAVMLLPEAIEMLADSGVEALG